MHIQAWILRLEASGLTRRGMLTMRMRTQLAWALVLGGDRGHVRELVYTTSFPEYRYTQTGRLMLFAKAKASDKHHMITQST